MTRAYAYARGLALVFLLGRFAASALLDVDFSDNADFSVSLAGTQWLDSAPIRFFAANAWQNLTRASTTRSSGTDALGGFQCINISWSWAPAYGAASMSWLDTGE